MGLKAFIKELEALASSLKDDENVEVFHIYNDSGNYTFATRVQNSELIHIDSNKKFITSEEENNTKTPGTRICLLSYK